MIQRLLDLGRRTLVRNIMALYGVRLAQQLLPVIVIPYLARVLGPTNWGLVAFAQAFAIYGVVVVEYGFELAGTRAVARDRDESARLAELVTGVFATQVLLAGVIALAAVTLRNAVPAFEDQPLLLWAGLAFAVLQGLNPVWYFTGQERISLIAAIDVTGKLIGTGSIFLLVDSPDDGWLVLAAYAGAASVTTVAGYGLILRGVRPRRPSLGLIGRTLRLGFSMFLMRTSVMMHTAGNTFLLGLLVAPQHVAFFVAGEKLCRPAAWLLQPINVALLPRLSNLIGHSPDQARHLAGLGILLMGAIGVSFGLGIALLAPWLVALLFGAGYETAVPVLRTMALIVPLIVLNSALISQWLVPHGLDRGLNVVVLSAAAFNLVLALLIAPTFKAIGMAWVTVAVELYVLLGLMVVLRRHALRPFDLAALRQGVAWIAAAIR